MLKHIIAASLLATSAGAGAATYVATIDGVVTSKFDTIFTAPGAPDTISVGDTIKATFRYSTGASDNGGVSGAMGSMLSYFSSSHAKFELAGFTWTSAGDFNDLGHAPRFDLDSNAMAGFQSTMDDAPGGGDLEVNGYAFEIGEFGYQLYTGFGYSGLFDSNSLLVMRDDKAIIGNRQIEATAVPEPATWAMMVLGFGMAAAAVRARRAPRLTLSAV